MEKMTLQQAEMILQYQQELAKKRDDVELETAIRLVLTALAEATHHPAWQCSHCQNIERFPKSELHKPCPNCNRTHYWTGSIHNEPA